MISPDDDDRAATPLERQQLHVTAASAHTFWHWVRFRLVVAQVRRHRGVGVVDVGAGSGMLGDWMSTHHPDLGYRFDELSPTLDAALVERFGADARADGVAAIPDDQVVTLLDVIEHVEDDAAMLRALFDRMAPGGLVVVTVPALQWAFSSWDVELGHFRRYDRRGLSAVLRTAGFDVTHLQYLFPEMLPLLPIRKLRRAPRTSVDFPELGPLVNRVGYALSSLTASGGRFLPSGTSVFAAARKPLARTPS